MSRDHRHLLDADEPLDGEAPRRIAPGKVSLTQRLASNVQRRAAGVPSSNTGSSHEGVGYLGAPASRNPTPAMGPFAGDDPFALHLLATPVQRKANLEASEDHVHAAAARGLDGPATTLPFLDQIQASFGAAHDVSHVKAHVGGAAAEAASAMGATAFASGDQVAFAGAPDLHTAAHEAAHVVQQRGGVQLKGGVGQEGDAYERHADAVADQVVRGESAAALLMLGASVPTVGATAVQRRGSGAVGMGDVRRADGGDSQAIAENTGPEAGFLRQLTARDIVQSPQRLRLERGRPGTVNFLPMSAEPLPGEAAPVPLYCKLLGRDGQAVDEIGGTWHPLMATGPLLTLTVPGPEKYGVELHVNAGRPGGRVLTWRLRVHAADEEDVASDEGSRLRAAASNDDHAPPPPVETYRDMLAAVLAAAELTDQGDEQSYARAIKMLEPVVERLHAIYPRLIEKRSEYGAGQQAIDLRFGTARGSTKAWLARLRGEGTINAAEKVNNFRAGEDEIKLGTGEQTESSDLRGFDQASRTTATVVAVGTAAVIALPIAYGAGAAAGTKIMLWAGANPQTALVLAEIAAGMGIQFGEDGLDGFLRALESDEDLAWTVFQILMDYLQARQGVHADNGPALPPGRSRGALPPGSSPDALPPGPTRLALPPGADDSTPAPGTRTRQPGGDEPDGAPPRRAPDETEDGATAGRGGRGQPHVDAGERKAVIARASAEAGMQEVHVGRIAALAARLKQTIIMRAGNPKSLDYHGQEGYRAKPSEVKELKTAKDGPNAGLVVKPADPTPEQAEEIRALEGKGWKFDADGALVDPEGMKIHGDYDMQGVYAKGDDGQQRQVDTNDKKFQKTMNDELGHEMVQHGANDKFKVTDASGNETMGRQPGASEKFLVAEPDGSIHIVNGAAALQRYYENHGIKWPYNDAR